MSSYLDPSLLVSALVRDIGTERVQEWLMSRAGEALWVSDWTMPEVASALSLKVRLGTLEAAQHRAAMRIFDDMVGASLGRLDVSRAAFETAARYVGQHELSLRAPDGLHLAVAAEHDLTLCTRDQKQAEAGRRLGLRTELV